MEICSPCDFCTLYLTKMTQIINLVVSTMNYEWRLTVEPFYHYMLLLLLFRYGHIFHYLLYFVVQGMSCTLIHVLNTLTSLLSCIWPSSMQLSGSSSISSPLLLTCWLLSQIRPNCLMAYVRAEKQVRTFT